MPEIVNISSTKNPGQRSLDISDAYLARFTPGFNQPPNVDANAWRNIVGAQPVATTCRDTLISSILSLDWKITVRDSKLQDELAGTINHYTRLLERSGYGSALDYTSHVEWIAGDLLDTPFGGAAEIGRKGDSENGRVMWIEPLDAGTLYPTLNHEFPVVQYYLGQQIAFPKHAISRVYMRPRPRIEYKGWGIAPPETIFLALNMLARGDVYYANLLLDIPTTGILDLGDMEKDSALEWVDAYRDLLANGGNASFKIPVLYEHQNEIKFVPFGKVPNDIMFDRITLKYAGLVAAAYGMSLSDIGISTTSNGGETLAGTIRSERKTRKTGFARLKKKLKFYFEQILPPMLQFNWIDYDDEVNIALGRARLANATAFKIYKDTGMITAKEGRQQLIADGMFTISMPEDIPDDGTQATPETSTGVKTGNVLGHPVAPSMGGQGEVRKSFVDRTNFEVVKAVVSKILAETIDDFIALRSIYGEDNLHDARKAVEENLNPGEVTADGWLQVEGVEEKSLMVAEKVIEKIILLTLKDTLLADNVGVDFSDAVVYDTLLTTVTDNVRNLFDEIVETSIETNKENV